jgi:hypothetical protein
MPDNRNDARREEYLRRAAESRERAGKASSSEERVRWEEIAGIWEFIAVHALPGPGERI